MIGKRRRGTRPPSAGKQEHQLGREMSPALLHSLNHPIRRQILRLLSERGAEWSPVKMTQLIAGGLSTLSFHVKTLSDQKVIRCAKTRQVRGSIEHIYVSDVLDNELVAEILRSTQKDDSFLWIRSEPTKDG